MADEEGPPVSNVLRHPVLERYDRGEPPGGGPPGGGQPEAPDFWEACPFQVLGRGAGRYWFLDATGELVDVTGAALAHYSKLLELCAGERDWLLARFRQLDSDGNPTAWFVVREAVAAIMRRAGTLASFDAEIPRRRYGLWRVADGYALHRGETIDWCGVERRAGFVEERALWLRLSPRPSVGAPADASLGRELEALFSTWNWRHSASPGVLLGLVVSGWIAGALDWRPHGLVVGEAGSGKTTLLRDVIAGLCPLTRYLNDYTEPGLRQLLSESATSIVLDEAEGDSGTEQRLRRTIEMLRRASSGSGVQSVKGSADHVARQFTLSGSAIMGAIFPPPLEPQDASRFTVLELGPLDPDGAAKLPPASFALRHGAALWGRAIAQVARIDWLIGILRARIIARGYGARLADQLATIAACRWVMVRDTEDDPRGGDVDDDADVLLAVVEHLFVDETERVEAGAGNQALGRLLMTALDMAGDKKALGQVLARVRVLARDIAAAAQEVEAANLVAENRLELRKLDALLQAHGVRWGACEDARGDAPAPPNGLFVVVGAHPRLERAFADTSWAGKRWGAALRQLPGALGSSDVRPQRIGGAKLRVVWVPEIYFGAPESGT